MTILHRYILGRFIQTYLLTISGFIGIFLIIDFFERADEFLAKNAPMQDWLGYYVYKIPMIFSYMGPQAVLLATVVTLTALAKNNEFIAMKACGIGVTGATLPILGCSFLIALFLLGNSEFVMPQSSQKMNYIFKIKVRGGKPKYNIKRDKIWFRSDDGSIWNVQYYDAEKAMMKDVSIYHYRDRRMIEKRVDASAVFWNGRDWEFLDGYVREFSPKGLESTRHFDREIFPVAETPSDFKEVRKRPEEMSLRELYREIREQEREGGDPVKKWVDFYQKLSYPFVSVVLALIGIPLSLRSSRSGGLLFCVSLSLAFGLAFSFVYALGISLGNGGTFSPWLAGWGPALIFGFIGLYLLLTMDSEKILPI